MKRKKLHLSERVRSSDESVFRPQLTSLIDVMTILLVFLMKNFSVQGDIVTTSPDLILPVSTSQKVPDSRLSIEISRKSILGQGELLCLTSQVAASDSLVIPQLRDWLLYEKMKFQKSPRGREILIQCDRDIEFNIVKRVMATASKTGFEDFSILVIQKE